MHTCALKGQDTVCDDVQALVQCASLTHLDLSNNDLQVSCIKKQPRCTAKEPRTIGHKDRGDWTDSLCYHLPFAPCFLTTACILSWGVCILSCGFCQGEGAGEVVEALPPNTLHLDLSSNSLGDEGLTKVTRALSARECRHSLCHLDLRLNGLRYIPMFTRTQPEASNPKSQTQHPKR